MFEWKASGTIIGSRRAVARRFEGIAMYQPDHFRVADLPKMHALMRARPLATLVSAGSLGLYATHLPTVLKDDGLYGIIECPKQTLQGPEGCR